jgi:N-acetylglucosamine-6-phosphate deacetylase
MNNLPDFVLVNGIIIFPNDIVCNKALLIKNGLIHKIIDDIEVRELPKETSVIDVNGNYITPGLIDLHIHGCLGCTFNDEDKHSISKIKEYCLSNGVTSILATLSTAPLTNLLKNLSLLRKVIKESDPVILGVYLEGPFFNKEQSGAQDSVNIIKPTTDAISSLLEYSEEIKIFSLAPEIEGSIDLIKKLTGLGVIAAAGHSSATDKDFLAAMDAGLKHVTHIYSGQSSTIRKTMWRIPGLLEATLVYDGFTVEMIADNKHIPKTLMKLAYKCIGRDRLCIISDSTSGTGFPDGSTFRMGEVEYEVHNGVGVTLDRKSFAGSVTMINKMIPILREALDIQIDCAVQMMSLNPARILGVQKNKGSIENGKDADIAIFDKHFNCLATWKNGNLVYSKDHRYSENSSR